MSSLSTSITRTLLAGFMGLLAVAGCDDNTQTDVPPAPNLVPDGVFTIDFVDAEGFTLEDFTGLTLTVNRSEMSATLAGTPLEAPLTLSLEAVAESAWIRDCYTNGDNYSISEVFTLGAGPISIGELDMIDPALSTKCGGRVLLGTWTLDVLQEDPPVLGFVP
ncbi:MAG: hypothetical protein IPL79_02080 [Myxococcales bacterium]|nr:hypothetical protein [Myxococcales bacterium]